MKVALIYPPVGDPTAPYISIPSLSGWLRAHDIGVLPIDANLEGIEYLLQPRMLESLRDRISRRLARLERKGTLRHQEQLAWAALRRGKQLCRQTPKDMAAAFSVLRDPVRFFDPARYDHAVGTIEDALELIGAAFTPLEMDFTRYRTPFSLLSMDQIRSEARADRNPFFEFYDGHLAKRLANEKVGLVGISVVYTSQIQQAYTLAYILRRRLPDVHLTMGGPAITQMLSRLVPERRTDCLGPLDTAVLFEGEQPLLEIIREVAAGLKPAGIRQASEPMDLSGMPAPDFDGLPLSRYLSPAPVLPYDSTRGCYWGKCAFCHYGLTGKGTAPYRERPLEDMLRHLEMLSARHGSRLFYLSQDVMAPKTVHRLSREVSAAGRPWRWATDLRPEAYFSPEVCRDLYEGGALAVSLGIESGSRRLMELIGKGITVENQRAAIENLSAAGVAVEAMCFTDFPTESFGDAMKTLRLLEGHHTAIALFMCGRFELCSGSAVAARPLDFDLRELWYLSGDELRTTLCYAEKRSPKTASEAGRIEADLERISQRWHFRHYPWAGSLSTAHTLLWYDRFGPDIFKQLARRQSWPAGRRSAGENLSLPPRVRSVSENACKNEADLWHQLVHEKRSVSPDLYRELAERMPPVVIGMKRKADRFE